MLPPRPAAVSEADEVAALGPLASEALPFPAAPTHRRGVEAGLYDVLEREELAAMLAEGQLPSLP